LTLRRENKMISLRRKVAKACSKEILFIYGATSIFNKKIEQKSI
jgi:hypothetical protein